ncbi:MAG: PEGA domain-containing protein, partial [Deltaproteobacteria bacterium]|nr:PEGA domain-containing protein [Deltaproteobacteria bacterium]
LALADPDPSLVPPTLDNAQTIVRTAAPPRRRAWLVAVIAVAIAAIAIAVIASRGDAPTPAPIAIATPPDAAALVAPDAPPPDAPPPYAPPADAAPAPASAHIDIVTTPPGAIVIIGDNQVRSPVRIGVAPGAVTLKVEHDGYQPLTRTLQVEPGEHVTLELTLTRRASPSPASRVGYFTVRTTPYADVYLGARHLGQTPFADLPLPAGTHTLTFRHPAHRPVTRSVTIRAGETTRLRFDLP